MNQSGLVRFMVMPTVKALKPIIGVDFWVQSEELGDGCSRLVGLAMDNAGSAKSHSIDLKGYLRGHIPGRPVIDKAWLAEHSRGVILLSGGRMGDIGKFLLKSNQAMVERCTRFTNNICRSLLSGTDRTGRLDEETYLHGG